MRSNRSDTPRSASLHQTVTPRLKPSRGRGELLGVARVVPALIAVYELRYVLVHLVSIGAALAGADRTQLRSSQLWMTVLLALVTAGLLREISRGLRARIGRPRWSPALAGAWLLCFTALLALLCCRGLLTRPAGAGHSAGLSAVPTAGTWASVASALGIGLVLAVSLGGARWIIAKVAAMRRAKAGSRRRVAAVAHCASGVLRPAPLPLLAGWSDRGPPPVARGFA